MELIRGLYNIRSYHQGCVATIGNFDGVHLGHQAILQALLAQAEQYHLPSIAIIFEPQPQEYFSPTKAPARLTRLREKLAFLNEHGIDRVLCLSFNAKLAQLSPEQFIQNLLLDSLQVKHLIIGDDFRFGHNREGNFELLQTIGQQQGFQVEKIAPILCDDRRISSTWIREVLQKGDLTSAAKLLGRPYSLCGRVAHGDKRGRTIGVPTANIYLHRSKSPILGVYAVTVYGVADLPVAGVANIGHRPTVEGSRTLLEVHLFNFNQDIYGRYVQVNFHYKLRDEKRFDSWELLQKQIRQDIHSAQTYFIEKQHQYLDIDPFYMSHLEN